MLFAVRHTELLHAFVGTGQIVDEEAAHSIQERFIQECARTTGRNEALEQLEKQGKNAYETCLFEFGVPVCFCTGRFDYTTPFELVQRYYDRLNTPYKEMVWFEESAHFPFLEQPKDFAREMERVRSQTQPVK